MADSGRFFSATVRRRHRAVATAALSLSLASPLAADTPLSMVTNKSLNFGTFAVMGAAVRQVGADGSVTGSGLMAIRGSSESPAEYVVSYRAKRPSVVLSLTLGSVAPITINGVTGKLDNFVTDLPGAPVIQPGQSRTFVIPNCQQVTCSFTFRVGARLSLTGGTGGGTYVFPLPLSVRMIAEE